MQIQTFVLASVFNHTLKTGISACSLKHVRTSGERPWLQGPVCSKKNSPSPVKYHHVLVRSQEAKFFNQACAHD